MGKTNSKQANNAGTVVNEIEIHQAEIVNTELFVLLYVIVFLCVVKVLLELQKKWRRSLKKRYSGSVAVL